MSVRTLTLPTTHGPVQVDAHTTATDGLYVYRNGSKWRLAHHTGHTLADFEYDQHAHNAAKALGAITDWTQTAEQLRTDDGPAAHALAARGD